VNICSLHSLKAAREEKRLGIRTLRKILSLGMVRIVKHTNRP